MWSGRTGVQMTKQVLRHPPEAFYKKDVLKNFGKFTGKPLYYHYAILLKRDSHTGVLL